MDLLEGYIFVRLIKIRNSLFINRKLFLNKILDKRIIKEYNSRESFKKNALLV